MPQKVAKYMTDAQIRRRKKIASDIGYTGAAIGLTTLGAKGAQMGLRAAKTPGALKAATKIGRHTEGALILGSGIGAAGTINYAGINRAESNRKRKVVIPKRAPIAVIGQSKMKSDPAAPSARKTLKGTLTAINQGVVPEMPALTPGSRQIKRLSQATGLQKGLGRGLKLGWRAADHTRPAPARGYVHKPKPKTTVRNGPKATEVAGMKTGAAAHDFAEGYSRRVHPTSEVESGKITTHQTAVYPHAYKAGHMTRRYATPAVVIGGGYGVGRHIGRKRQENRMGVTKMAEEMGQLIPLSPDIVKTYGYDPEYGRHRRGGLASGSAYAGGTALLAASAHQGVKAGKKSNFTPNRSGLKTKTPGKLNSVRVSRGGLVHGGRAVGLAAAGGTALALGHHIKRKQTQGDWQSYDRNYS